MTALSFVLISIVLATLIFLRVYGPHLIDAFIESRAENARLAKLEQDHQENLRAAREIARINDQLATAFGGRTTRDLELSLEMFRALREAAKAYGCQTVDEDAVTVLDIPVAYLDDEFDLILQDESLSTEEKIRRLDDLVSKEK